MARFELTGIKESNKLIKQATVNINKALIDSMEEAGRMTSDIAKSNVVVETGLLRESIGFVTGTIDKTSFAVIGPRSGFRRDVVTRTGLVETRNPIRYANFVETGTIHSGAKPFLRPALEAIKSKIPRIMGDSFAKFDLD